MSLSQKTLSSNFRQYLRQLLLHEFGMTSLLIMELMWLLPWFRSFTPLIQASRAIVSSIALLVFFLSVTFINRFLRILSLRTIIHRIIMITILLMGIYSLTSLLVFPSMGLGLGEIVHRTIISLQNILEVIPEGFIVILVSIYLWWRGLAISSMGTLESRSTERKFRIGILTFAAFAIIFRGNQIDYLISALPVYFAFGLLAVTFSRTSSLGRGITGFRLPYTGRWFVGMAFITSLTVGIGIFVSKLLQSELAYSMYGFFSESFAKLLTLLEIILLPVVELFIFLANKVIEFLSRYIDPESLKGIVDQMQNQPTPELSIEQAEQAFRLPPEVIAVVVLLALTVLIILLVRRANQQQRYGIPEFEDDGDTIRKPRETRSRIRKLLDQFREGFETIQKFGIGRRMIAATIIRRIYTMLLDTASELGHPRYLSETPFEFQQRLFRIFPKLEGEIGLITDAYVQVRYGEIPEEERIISMVEAAWAAIETEAKHVERGHGYDLEK
jgi:hypothetical protein